MRKMNCIDFIVVEQAKLTEQYLPESERSPENSPSSTAIRSCEELVSRPTSTTNINRSTSRSNSSSLSNMESRKLSLAANQEGTCQEYCEHPQLLATENQRTNLGYVTLPIVDTFVPATQTAQMFDNSSQCKNKLNAKSTSSAALNRHSVLSLSRSFTTLLFTNGTMTVLNPYLNQSKASAAGKPSWPSCHTMFGDNRNKSKHLQKTFLQPHHQEILNSGVQLNFQQTNHCRSTLQFKDQNKHPCREILSNSKKLNTLNQSCLPVSAAKVDCAHNRVNAFTKPNNLHRDFI